MASSPASKHDLDITQDFFPVSGGVELRVIDLCPAHDTPDAPVVVFVAGWISLIAGWKEVLAELTRGYRVLYVETREKKSARLPSLDIDFSIDRMARDIGELVPQTVAADRPVYLAGSSLGSTVVLHAMANEYVQAKEALLVGPVDRMHFPSLAVHLIRPLHPNFYLVVKPWIKWYLANIRCDKEAEPEQVKKYEGTLDAAEPARLKANALAIKDYEVWDQLGKIKDPVLLIGAAADSLHGVEVLERMRDDIPRARLEILASNKETHSGVCGDLMARTVDKREKTA